MADSGRSFFAAPAGAGAILNGGFSPLPHLYAWTEGGPLNTMEGVPYMSDEWWEGVDVSDDTTGGDITFNPVNGGFTVHTTGVYVINFKAGKDGTETARLQVGGGTGWFGPTWQSEWTVDDYASAFLTVPLGAGAVFIPTVNKVGATDFDVTSMEVQVARII